MTLLWLAILLWVLFSVKSMMLGRLNQQITRNMRQATHGYIQEVEVDFSLAHAMDFLKAAKQMVTAFRQPGRPMLEEIILSEPTLEMSPVADSGWRLRLYIRGLYASAGTKKQIMTRTRIQKATLVLYPDSQEPVRISEFNFQVLPDHMASLSELEYQISAVTERWDFTVQGKLGQSPNNSWLIGCHSSAKNVPLKLVCRFFSCQTHFPGLGGNLFFSGHLEYTGGKTAARGWFSVNDFEYSPGLVESAKLDEWLQQCHRQGFIERREFMFDENQNHPGFEWDKAAVRALLNSTSV